MCLLTNDRLKVKISYLRLPGTARISRKLGLLAKSAFTDRSILSASLYTSSLPLN